MVVVTVVVTVEEEDFTHRPPLVLPLGLILSYGNGSMPSTPTDPDTSPFTNSSRL